MTVRFWPPVLATLVIAGCASNKPSHPNAPAAAASPSTSKPSPAGVLTAIDVCGLLSRDDLTSVQGEAYKDAQRSDHQEGDLIVAQCYYLMPNTADSVVLNVTTSREGPAGRSPRQFWAASFGKDEGSERLKKEGAPEKTEKSKAREREEEPEAWPEKVKGLGDEAFWVASRVGGALYVLKNDRFFRISVGGTGDETAKLNKSKRLAQMILKKF